ncbi:hypothetical protein [Actinomycetospora aeridis]|uniref:Uncharacterized protein n=1 Tax=Actinomycetospora aeridis TaxID=3129231 RepID=A0ABU8N0T6_9PSEU
MGVASRQGTCAACGGPLGRETDLEFLIDDTVRMVAVHPGHSTQPDRALRPGERDSYRDSDRDPDRDPDDLDPDDALGAAA